MKLPAFLNIKEFMNDYKEWHAFVEGFSEVFCIWKPKHELSGELLEDLKGEHHYYTFGRVVGFICLVLFGLFIWSFVKMKEYKRQSRNIR